MVLIVSQDLGYAPLINLEEQQKAGQNSDTDLQAYCNSSTYSARYSCQLY